MNHTLLFLILKMMEALRFLPKMITVRILCLIEAVQKNRMLKLILMHKANMLNFIISTVIVPMNSIYTRKS